MRNGACIIAAMHRLRIGVMGSGKGSNFQAILDAILARELAVDPVLVVSDVAEAGILGIAREAGIATHVIEEPRFRTKLSPEVEEDVSTRLLQRGVEVLVLAGYMRMVGTPMLRDFRRRMINIHPSLLPKFPGLASWRQALEAGETTTGCTVHFVDAGMDTGEIIAQREVPILAGDTAETLHARIQIAEHALFPAVIARFAKRELP